MQLLTVAYCHLLPFAAINVICCLGLVARNHSCCRVAQRLLHEGSDAEIYELTPVREQECFL